MKIVCADKYATIYWLETENDKRYTGCSHERRVLLLSRVSHRYASTRSALPRLGSPRPARPARRPPRPAGDTVCPSFVIDSFRKAFVCFYFRRDIQDSCFRCPGGQEERLSPWANRSLDVFPVSPRPALLPRLAAPT